MRSFPRTILYAVAGVLVIALISSALTMIIMNRTSGDRVVMSAEEYSEFSQIAALDDVMDSIEKEYYAEVPSREKMIAGAATRSTIHTPDITPPRSTRSTLLP